MTETKLTVDAANAMREASDLGTRQRYDLIECCLNAKAAFSMMGCVAPPSRDEFLPVGVLALVQIRDLLKTMPEDAALVKASMAFACEVCGCPAESGSEDCWTCEDCSGDADDPARPLQGGPER